MASRTSLRQVESLQELRVPIQDAVPLYPCALQVPSFLQQNLRNEQRVVKQFQGEDALIRAFAFSVMKLGFELESEGEDYGSVVRSVLLGEGQGELEDSHFSDKQYRRLLVEFLDLLQDQDIPNFEETINLFPVVDQILLKFFKHLVPLTLLIPDAPSQTICQRVLQFLCSDFRMKVEQVSGCFKLVQADIFIYASSHTQIYLVFVDHLAFIKEVTEDPSSEDLSTGSPSKPKDFVTVINILQSNKAVGSQNPSFASKSQQDIIKESKASSITSSKQVSPSLIPPLPPHSKASSKSSKPPSQPAQSLKSSSSKPIQTDSPYELSKISVRGGSSRDSQYSSQFSSYQAKPTSYQSDMRIREPMCQSKLQENERECKTRNFIKTYGGFGNRCGEREKNTFNSQICRVERVNQVKDGRENDCADKKSEVRKIQVKKDADDSGYCKFSESGFLDCLEEEYRTQIRSIKRKYREKRENIRLLI